MKTIILKSTKLSKYIYSDDTSILSHDHYTEVHSIGDIIYLTDVYSENSDIINNVPELEEWERDKYRYEPSMGWVLSNGLESLTLEESKVYLMNQLKEMRKMLSATINECVLINNPIPPQLASLIDNTRDMYNFGKYEIDSLTEDNYRSYVLQGPQVNALIGAFQAFL